MSQPLTEDADSAFQFVELHGGVASLAEQRAPSPTPTEPADDIDIKSEDDAAFVKAEDDLTDTAIAMDTTDDGLAATAGGDGLDHAATAANPAVGVAPPAAAPTVTGAAYCLDPMENRAGVAFGVVPVGDLVPGNMSLMEGKYYAVARGRFIGVFDDSSMHTMAVGRVSNPISHCPKSLGAALSWFNTKRVMGYCEVVN
ncbi:hypothetical protein BD626DRAFT_575800 [Schizophyllum amplum]|uniref:Uncharacterized protein n=1 Tax=Schizophyllum amplum TaxID=97359 RepID=A0A550BUW6_9AGAR|nr:hypothetical protein BD626DRAFT_575800 [Auriculariopsis ampla]